MWLLCPASSFRASALQGTNRNECSCSGQRRDHSKKPFHSPFLSLIFCKLFFDFSKSTALKLKRFLASFRIRTIDTRCIGSCRGWLCGIAIIVSVVLVVLVAVVVVVIVVAVVIVVIVVVVVIVVIVVIVVVVVAVVIVVIVVVRVVQAKRGVVGVIVELVLVIAVCWVFGVVVVGIVIVTHTSRCWIVLITRIILTEPCSLLRGSQTCVVHEISRLMVIAMSFQTSFSSSPPQL